MLDVGHVGWSAKVRPTRHTPDEQHTHFGATLARPFQLNDAVSVLLSGFALEISLSIASARG
jgi:hypothetical protein